MNLYQNEKNLAISSTCYGDIGNLKILQSDWLRAFWPISSELDFSRTWSLCRNTENKTKFHYRTNSGKINVRNFSINSKNFIFGPFSPIFGLKKMALSSSYGFLTRYQNLEKIVIQRAGKQEPFGYDRGPKNTRLMY